uniref:Uncharacterized protein n=1 Tax=Spirodela intermedia TaxID=51605 RepID=A0A8S0XAC4_SPIIN
MGDLPIEKIHRPETKRKVYLFSLMIQASLISATRSRALEPTVMDPNPLRLGKQREDVYERDIQQQEERKGLNRGTPEHLLISDVSISMERVTHYFDESFLRQKKILIAHHFSDELAMIYLIHA